MGKVMLLFGTFALTLLSGCTPRSFSKSSGNVQVSSSHFFISQDYLQALNTADQFLSAWLNNNLELGISLLSQRAKKGATPQELSNYFSSRSNPFHEGFEIISSKKVNSNDYRFDVWLYGYFMGQSPDPYRQPQPESVDVVKIGQKWFINNLPESGK